MWSNPPAPTIGEVEASDGRLRSERLFMKIFPRANRLTLRLLPIAAALTLTSACGSDMATPIGTAHAAEGIRIAAPASPLSNLKPCKRRYSPVVASAAPKACSNA